MDNKLISSKYFRYAILIFFVITLSITLVRFDVNIISDLFFNVVSSLNSNSFFGLTLIFIEEIDKEIWIILKIFCVILISLFHVYCGKIGIDFLKKKKQKKRTFFSFNK